ncbi:hypothetical protein IGI37_002230 [Enterococcus sp. AZ194]|uniref:DUF3781 domain-containing protein n=1 Tax=Enterococcus sp. AZ194 TaxID=2774629 RepID=UPI003F29CBDD
MNNLRNMILSQICYTDLVYGRINKKLRMTMTKAEIEKFIYQVVECENNVIYKLGKNYYIEDKKTRTRVTINSYTYRVITADKL